MFKVETQILVVHLFTEWNRLALHLDWWACWLVALGADSKVRLPKGAFPSDVIPGMGLLGAATRCAH